MKIPERHNLAGTKDVQFPLSSASTSPRLDVCTKSMHTGTVGFEWDEEGKAGINFRRHGVRMPAAIPVFDDPYAITITDEESDPGEQKFVTVGVGATGRLLVVAYT
jgi:uncharacterized DUF497 family protein